MYKKPEVNLKLKYKKVLEASLLISFLLITSIFLAFKKFEFEKMETSMPDIQFQVDEIPQTQQIKRPNPPSQPAVPVESDDPELEDDVTIDATEIDMLEDIPTLPPAPKIEEAEEEEIPTFLPIEDQPKLIGGMTAIYDKLVYPEIAIKAQVEGATTVRVLVGRTGMPEEVVIVRSSGNQSLDEAATKACWEGARYTPAKQRSKPVRFRITHRIIFRLTDDK
ncbi:energy transducer TonB [candidate division KSB1 bacterium]